MTAFQCLGNQLTVVTVVRERKRSLEGDLGVMYYYMMCTGS